MPATTGPRNGASGGGVRMMNATLSEFEGSAPGTQNLVLGTQYSVPSEQQRLGKIKSVPRRPARIPGLKERLILRVASFLQSLLGCRGKDCFGILMYHRVTESIPGVPEPTWNVTPSRFEEQLGGLLARGFEAWPLRKVLEFHQVGKPIPRRAFVVTFDDGYKCVYTQAWPILQKLNIPATIFLSTAYLDTADPFPADDWLAAGEERVPTDAWRILTTEQCREMQSSGLFELAAHTHTHDDFRDRPDDLLLDLEQNRKELKERFGLQQPTFAFPFGVERDGFAGGVMSEIAREADFQCALSTEPDLVLRKQDPFSWGRFPAEQHDTTATLAAKLGGWTSALRGIKRALRRRFRK
jgi:peptidoglycan/xylan/chitin deacetylase (PgdA/CDA1 family)